MNTIILTGGGTAGHCTPHLSILPYLKKDFKNVYYIGSKNGIEKEIIEKANIKYFPITCQKLVRKITIKNLKIPFSLIKGVNEAGAILDKVKPNVIFSKGGYVALPVVLAAKRRNIPVIAHESDYTVGLANKISSRYCKKMLTSFPETAKNLKNGEYVGSPIRINLNGIDKEKTIKEFGFNGKKPIILITGGSTGAKAINDCVRKTLDKLLQKFNILHVCGKGNLDNKLENTKGYYQTEYLHELEKAYAVASLCISRAGSNTLFELLSIKMPTLLIPLPKGVSRGDQVLNANYFYKKGMVNMLEQENLTPESLYNEIMALFNNKKSIISNISKNPICDKSRQISRLIVDYALK